MIIPNDNMTFSLVDRLDSRLLYHIREELKQIDNISNISLLNHHMFTKGIDYLLDYHAIGPPADGERKILRITFHDWTSTLDTEPYTYLFINRAFVSIGIGGYESAGRSLFRLISQSSFLLREPNKTITLESDQKYVKSRDDLSYIGLTESLILKILHVAESPPGSVWVAHYEHLKALNEELEHENGSNAFNDLKHLAKLALVIEYGKYYSAEFNRLYLEQVTRVDRTLTTVQRLHLCMNMIDHYAPLLLTRVYITQINDYKTEISVIESVLEEFNHSIAGPVIKMISASKWLTPHERSQLQAKAGKMSFKWAFPEWVSNTTIFNDQYLRTAEWDEENAFNVFGQLTKMRSIIMRFHLDYYSKSSENWPGWPISPIRTKYLFDEFHQHDTNVYIPLSLLGDHFFRMQREATINIATFGSLVIQSLMRLLTLPIVDNDSTVSQRPGAAYRNRSTAMMEFYNNLTVDIEDEEFFLVEHLKSSEFRPQVFDAAFKITFFLCFNERRQEPVVRDDRHTARQWYFIAHTSQFCSHHTNANLKKAILNGYIPERFIFNNLALSFNPLREAFQCPFYTLPNLYGHRLWLDT